MSKQVAVIVLLSVIAFLGLILVLNKREVSVETIQNQANEQSPTTTQNQATDIQASFAIFTNGTFRIFTASMYHNLSQDVYIEASNPNIVHIKKSGTTWNDFFLTLPVKLTKNCLTTGTGETFCNDDKRKLRFYLNGKEDPNALDKQIKSTNKLLVSYGNENEAQIMEQLQRIR